MSQAVRPAAHRDLDGLLRWGARLGVAALALVALVVAAIGFAQEWAARDVASRRESYRLARRAMTLALDRETGLRGFLATRDSTFLEPELAARAPLAAALDSLAALMREHPEQRLQADSARLALDAWDREFAAPVLANDVGDARSAATATRLARGKQLFDAVRAHVDAMAREEQRRYEADAHRARLARGIGLALIIALLVVLAVLLARFYRALVTQAHDVEHGRTQLQEQAVELEYQLEQLHAQAAELEAMIEQQRVVEIELAAREREARESEHELRTVFECISEAFFALDAEWCYTYVNPRFETLYGHTLASLRGQRIQDAFPTIVGSRFEREFQRAIETGQTVRFTERSAVNGRWLDVAAYPSADGGVSVYLVDVSDRRALEEQYRQAQKMEAVGQLAGGVAHDFNNVLTAITGFAQFAMSDLPEESPSRADLQQVLLASDRAASLTRQLLAFSRRQVLQPREVDLNDVVASIGPMLRRVIGAPIEFATRPSAMPVPVFADPNQLELVLLNLAVNARDAMPSGGRLLIEVATADLDTTYAEGHPGSTAGPHAMLAVSDTGVGMDRATQARIFEPFFTTKPKGVGTGLGLATVYGIVKQSGGSIYVYSEPGRGTTFKVYLPRVDATRPRTPLPRATPAVQARTAVILLVEDDAQVSLAARRALEREGHHVLLAADGAEAFATLDALATPPDLLITDLLLPKMSGRELAARVRERWPEMPVLFVSGYTPEAANQQGMLAPDDAFLDKPFTPAALGSRVSALLATTG